MSIIYLDTIIEIVQKELEVVPSEVDHNLVGQIGYKHLELFHKKLGHKATITLFEEVKSYFDDDWKKSRSLLWSAFITLLLGVSPALIGVTSNREVFVAYLEVMENLIGID